MQKTVLYVEDEIINQMTLKALLSSLNFGVEITGSAEEAIALLEKPNTHIDIIMVDLGLPNMNGIELTRRIRASNWAAKNVPIIIVTGNDTEAAKQESLSAGATVFLTKPVRKETLEETFSKL